MCRVGSQGLGRRKEGKSDLSGLHSLYIQLEKGWEGGGGGAVVGEEGGGGK